MLQIDESAEVLRKSGARLWRPHGRHWLAQCVLVGAQVGDDGVRGNGHGAGSAFAFASHMARQISLTNSWMYPSVPCKPVRSTAALPASIWRSVGSRVIGHLPIDRARARPCW